MGDSKSWGLQRYAVLAAVAALHVAFLAALLLSLASRRPAVALSAIQLILLPTTDKPRIVSDNPRPERLTGASIIEVSPPVLASLAKESGTSLSDGPKSSAEGAGSAVDWAAEAHRALQAFEIRNHQPKNDILVAGSAAEDHWWPRGPHRAGDQFKNANGDWIVWVSPTCYQIARSGSTHDALSAAPPATLCLKDGDARNN